MSPRADFNDIAFGVKLDSTAITLDTVRGKPFAVYRLRFAPDESKSLLTVQVMADSRGKCGAGQVVHALNVMCGFEESLGVE